MDISVTSMADGWKKLLRNELTTLNCLCPPKSKKNRSSSKLEQIQQAQSMLAYPKPRRGPKILFVFVLIVELIGRRFFAEAERERERDYIIGADRTGTASPSLSTSISILELSSQYAYYFGIGISYK